MTGPQASTMQPLDATGRSLLFTGARTANLFRETSVTDEQLKEIWDLACWSPSAANSQPLRVLFIRSELGRNRLIPHMDEGNQVKVRSAAAVAVLAYDQAFHAHLPTVFPARGEAIRARFASQPSRREELARHSAALQAGVFLLAVRAVGLAAGPMGGFDPAGIDADLLAGTTWRSHLVVNIGHPAPGPSLPRLPRLAEKHALRWL